MQINLNNCFPIGAEGTRAPLPKQEEFLKLALSKSPRDPKFIAYVGGIGSGKTLIGCITVLSWAVMYPGEYLICRQFMPELKVTTLKTFLEICPKELIAEQRVADNYIKIKAINGQLSTVYFRQLEEPDKLRSMNLSGFMIDEANQVSEEAFTLLQGRLRGAGIRKGIIVSNPNGHDWLYRLFFKKDALTEIAKSLYHLIRAPSTENVHLPDGYIDTLLQSWSRDRIMREIEGSFDAFEGAVYEEFRRDIHVVKGFRIPKEWPRYIGIDHGYRNPSAWVWCAIGPDSEVYVYREFYESEWLIKEIVNGDKKAKKIGVMSMQIGEKPTQAFIDPSTKNRRGTTGESDWDEYIRQLPIDFPLYPAQNDVQVGIDRVKSYLKVNARTGRPNLYIFDTCINLIEEMTQYRYPGLKPNQEGQKAQNEKPMKVDDHALDALRYVVITLPEPYIVPKKDRIKHGTLEGALQQELAEIHRPKNRGPFTQ